MKYLSRSELATAFQQINLKQGVSPATEKGTPKAFANRNAIINKLGIRNKSNLVSALLPDNILPYDKSSEKDPSSTLSMEQVTREFLENEVSQIAEKINAQIAKMEEEFGKKIKPIKVEIIPDTAEAYRAAYFFEEHGKDGHVWINLSISLWKRHFGYIPEIAVLRQVIAHEMSHGIQDQLGIHFSSKNSKTVYFSSSRNNNNQVNKRLYSDMELHADFLSGLLLREAGLIFEDNLELMGIGRLAIGSDISEITRKLDKYEKEDQYFEPREYFDTTGLEKLAAFTDGVREGEWSDLQQFVAGMQIVENI
jgi:hypothetical protein